MAYEMVMPYHLHMPSYFLETFTEYPFTRKIRKIRQNPHLTRSIAGNFGDTKETAEDHPVNGK